MYRKLHRKIGENAISGIPKGEFGKPEYVAEVVGFLASPATEWMTGQAINISGGLEPTKWLGAGKVAF